MMGSGKANHAEQHILWCGVERAAVLHPQMLLDNVVELLLAYGLPQLPFLPRPDPQPTPGVRLTLRHTYEVVQPNTVTIVFESTSARTVGPDVLQVRCRARLSN
jgi:hypothetical protein